MLKFVLHIIVALTVIIIMTGCIYEKQEVIISTEVIEQISEITIKENDNTIDIESDKEVDAQAIEPVLKCNSIIDDIESPINSEDILKNEAEPLVEEEEIEIQIKTEPAFYLSEYERNVVECMVMGESGAEPYDGQLLVAQCIINACLKEGIQPSEVRKKYGYAGWNSNPSDSVKEAVSVVFDEGYELIDEFILYFYAPKLCKSNWHESQRFITEVGGHRFFAEWETN